MSVSPEHLIIAPIVVPFLAGALTLIYDERQRRAKLAIGLLSCAATLLAAIELLARSKGSDLTGGNDIGFYLLGDWSAPYGIVLVVDRLSAMMLVLTGLLALPALIFSAAGTHRQGQHFHAMFQFLLMGLNGAFLTGDLFNLFVFFEVLLAASYGLLMHGGGEAKVRSGLHYIAINLAASLLFLVGVSLVYGVTGTLNMAHLVQLVPGLNDDQRPLFHAGAGIMAVAFLVKAGIWPLAFWLPSTYAAGAPPVAALFAVMTKVGVYVLVRLSFLIFGVHAGASAGFGAQVLLAGGLATVTFGLLGVLASREMDRVAAFVVMVSSGTVIAAAGVVTGGGPAGVLSAALFYMLGSTLAVSAAFLLIEPMRRLGGEAELITDDETDDYDDPDDDPRPEMVLAFPGAVTVLSLAFAVTMIALTGLPPLSGFIGKLGMVQGLLEDTGRDGWAWGFIALLFLSGFATLLATLRIGIRTFWGSEAIEPPRILALEFAPILLLVTLLVVLSAKAEVTLGYMVDTTDALLRPAIYAEGVLGAPRAEDAEVAE
ncbi:monovalent cation/H+ antiporter subunit D [Tabrizicola sp.]|uniref:monovalent cation/H+ antiporter subunit D n=1 Tax=Tabrizicola sp. TaxID=2005166 RepID=UPI001A385F0E|nr:monovalent cation/H+ antiporter subunit D [Tabrizicola sp.]MBL9073978.1 monovalent cation/H+ antiporter subunit D [Tabrizicola sp.]